MSIDDSTLTTGGNIERAHRVVARIERELGLRVPPVAVLHTASIAELAKRIESTAPWSPLVRMGPTAQPPSERTPLFLVHGGDGYLVVLDALARRLVDRGQPVYGFEAQGLNGDAPPIMIVDDMVALYITAMKRAQPKGPYCIGGFSLGGMIAFAIAQELRRRGDDVGLLVLLDTTLLTLDRVPLRQKSRRLVWRLDLERRAVFDDPLGYVKHNVDRVRRVKAAVDVRLGRPTTYQPPPPRPKQAWLNDVVRAIYRPLCAYRMKSYDGRALFIRTRQPSPEEDRYAAVFNDWSAVVPRRLLHVCHVPGSHMSMLRPPHVDVVAAAVDEALRAAQA